MVKSFDIDANGAMYLPFAEWILRRLKIYLTSCSLKAGRKQIMTPDGVGFVEVRTRQDTIASEWYDYIRIETTTGTPQGFLLMKDGLPRFTVDGKSRSTFRAYYVDGKVEPIKYQAPSGTETDVLAPLAPVVIPPPVRSRGYKLPSELQDTYVDGALQPHLAGYPTASRFSGLMREVAGNYHIRGQNIPFAYWWTKTHGLVKMPPTAAATAAATIAKPAANQYWIVEVTASGIYAAPVTNNGTRSGSWSVTKYMPTAAMLAADPTLAGFKSSLSLSWARSALPNSGVVFLPVDVTAAYVGGPFYAGHGWAFNYSGTEAQAVTNVWSETPAQHYSCSRFKLTFSLSGTDSAGKGILACALSTVEDSLPATFYNSQVLWVPTAVAQVWDYVPQVDSVHQAAALAAFPNQDAPIAVYYDGDTEMVTRFKYTTHSGTEDTYTPIPPDYATSSTPFGYFNSYTANGSPGGFRFTGDTFHHIFQAGITTGFTAPGYDGIAEGRSYQTWDDHMTYTSQDGGDTVTESGGGCITDYARGFRGYLEHQVRTYRTGTKAQHGSMAFLMNEREGMLGVKSTQMADTYEQEQSDYYVVFETTWSIAGRNTCNKTGAIFGLDPVNSIPPFGIFGTSILTPTTSDNSYTADATLLLAGFAHIADAITNAQLSPFLITGLLVGEHPVVSGVFGMHGNLYNVNSGLVPPDQKANRVVWMTSGAPQVFGGFTQPTDTEPLDVIAFVGKA